MSLRLTRRLLPMIDSDVTGLIGDMTRLVNKYGGVYFPMQERSGTVAVAVNPALALGRNVALDINPMVAGVNWAEDANWAIAAGVATHTGGAADDLTQAGILAAGTSWQTIITVTNRTAGDVTIEYGTAPGATRSTNATFTETVTANGADLVVAASNAFDGDINFTSVRQTNIAASTTFAAPGDNPLDGAITGATIGQAANSKLKLAYLFDGVNDYVDIHSTELNSILDPTQGTLAVFVRVSGAGVWTDGLTRHFASLTVDGNNKVFMRKGGLNNFLEWNYKAGGTSEILTKTISSPTDWFMVAITWKTAMRSFYNGVQNGTDQAIAGTFIGNLTVASIGSDTLAPPTLVMDGFLTHGILLTDELSVAEIETLAKQGGVF